MSGLGEGGGGGGGGGVRGVRGGLYNQCTRAYIPSYWWHSLLEMSFKIMQD